ncbi:MAG: ABC transporter ATP-binding protein [Acidothermus sp.]|nr:ABC transporter ATP-binding protein [Acidothermus sp.]
MTGTNTTQAGLAGVAGETSLADVTVEFGKTVALNGVSFDFSPGVTAILGPNGAGKSTLLGVLATLIEPTAGTVCIAGEPIHSRPALRRARQALGYLPQHPDYFDHLTVLEALHYAAWLKGLGAAQRREKVGAAVDRFGLQAICRQKLRTLSGGTRRRVYLASAVVHDPRVVVLDEPTSGLDPTRRADVRAVLDQLRENIVVFSTQLTEEVELLADRVLVMSAGHLVFSGTPKELAAVAGTDQPSVSVVEAALRRLTGTNGER